MSVGYTEPFELADAVSVYISTLTFYNSHNTSRGPDPGKLALALAALHHANVMALSLSYPDDASNAPNLLDPNIMRDLDPDNVRTTMTTRRSDMQAWVQSMRRFVWNTITNAGTHCLPDNYERIILWAVRCVLDGLAGMYL